MSRTLSSADASSAEASSADAPAGAGGRRLPADQRREQLLQVALRQFGERGFRATTMDDVAEAAGVTKPLVYQHFRSKRDLYLELVDNVTKELLAAVQGAAARAEGPRQQVELGLAAYFDMVVHHAAFQILYDRDDADDPEVAAALRRVEDAMAEAIDPLIAAGLEPEHRRMLAYALVGMAEGASRHWVESRIRRSEQGLPLPPAQEEAERLASRLADMAWAGLRSVHAD